MIVMILWMIEHGNQKMAKILVMVENKEKAKTPRMFENKEKIESENTKGKSLKMCES